MTDDPVVQFSHQGEAKRTPIAQRADQVLFVTRGKWHGGEGPLGEVVDRGVIFRLFVPDIGGGEGLSGHASIRVLARRKMSSNMAAVRRPVFVLSREQ